ncbi:uncharacterized protein G2W53_031539 [Senna tora]|uniref:Uncharacterized protein n=1 Tax=Senna tora TaxID=362788 RepID=A0A834T9W4_9FABA|nr:uncharacterized protein G2W53_031539 [Senna tora]
MHGFDFSHVVEAQLTAEGFPVLARSLCSHCFGYSLIIHGSPHQLCFPPPNLRCTSAPDLQRLSFIPFS